MWNLLAEAGDLIQTHSCKVTSLEVSADGRRIASVADDAAMVWDTVTGQRAASFPVREQSRFALLSMHS